jgi:hypothetical protein
MNAAYAVVLNALRFMKLLREANAPHESVKLKKGI